MTDDYNPNSLNAVLSRLETKLDDALEKDKEHERNIGKLWGALGKLHLKVVALAATISAAAWVIEHFLQK